jgi:hypothetical protein
MAAKRELKGALIGVSVLWLGLLASTQGGEKFRARLSPIPVDASTATTIAGSGSVAAALVGTKLTIIGAFEGLRTPATVAHVHNGPKGVRGPVMFDLTVSKAVSGTISGTVALSRTQVQDLKDGKFYVQIHSEKAPEGNLWGWLLQ